MMTASYRPYYWWIVVGVVFVALRRPATADPAEAGS
jgi:hypothetical protein